MKFKGIVSFLVVLFFVFCWVPRPCLGMTEKFSLHEFKSHASFKNKVSTWLGVPFKKTMTVQVRDALTTNPLENAFVMMSENKAYTDKEGRASFEFKEESNFDITIAKAGYAAYTVFDLKQGDLLVSLEPLNIQVPTSKITGRFQGWPRIIDGDDRVDVGLIIPFIKLEQLLTFNFNSLLGPATKGTVYEERDVPGNLVLPKQREYFLKVLPVDFDHPQYTLELEKNATHNVVSLMGELPFTTVAKTFVNGGSLEKVLNRIKFTKMNLLTHFFVDRDRNFDIAPDQALKPNLTVQLNNVPKDRGVITVSAGNLDGKANEFFPMSFKMISKTTQQKNANLATSDLPGSSNFVVAIAADLPERTDDKGPFDKAASGIIQKDHGQKAWDGSLELNSFFNLITQNVSGDQKHFEFTNPKNPRVSPEPVMAISHLNYIIHPPKKEGQIVTPLIFRLWSLITPMTQTSFDLPHIPNDLELIPNPATTPEKDELQWEISVYAFQEAQSIINYYNINDENFRMYVSHFSRNSIVLKK